MGIAESAINIAADVFRGANDNAVRNLLKTVFERIQRTPDLINPSLLLETVKSLTWSVLRSVFGAVGSVSSIGEAVFRNEINATTLILVRDQASELVKFILDLVEVVKCYYLADGTQPATTDEHMLYKAFNELDLTEAMNRHAVLCQVQRLALSVIYILQNLFTPVTFRDINMSDHTNLQSDRGIGLQKTHTTTDNTQPNNGVGNMADRHSKMLNPNTKAAVGDDDEKWLFVNGIGGELQWLKLACNKLRAMFHRNITGVFNRGDGLLWDIIECAGQRSSYKNHSDVGSARPTADPHGVVEGQGTMIENTQSSDQAQKLLHDELLQRLDTSAGDSRPYIIMIAHSQGCLLLRRVLEDLTLLAVTDGKLRDTMQTRLSVFTFGSPSLHWKTQKHHPSPKDLDGAYLSSHVLRTEHFANRRDFVAQLGVLNRDSDYGVDEVFINEAEHWIGHLFGTQYSFNPEDYRNSNPRQSWLLGCCFGTKISSFIPHPA